MPRYALPAIMLIMTIVLLAAPAQAGAAQGRARGQTIYVPAYSHIYYTPQGHTFPLTTTLAVHNTDPKNPIQIVSARYYDAQGRLVQEYIAKPVTLAPLAARDLLVRKPDTSPGSGACFIVQWRAAKRVSTPIVECILIGATGQQGISFISRGRVVEQRD